MSGRRFSDAGGTPGGIGTFLLGFAMTCIGAYLLLSQVMVASSFRAFYGINAFGITLIPLLFGIAMLFWNGRSVIGWVLTSAAALFLFASILANLHIYFQPTSLFHTLIVLILLVGGLGLIARSLRPSPSDPNP